MRENHFVWLNGTLLHQFQRVSLFSNEFYVILLITAQITSVWKSENPSFSWWRKILAIFNFLSLTPIYTFWFRYFYNFVFYSKRYVWKKRKKLRDRYRKIDRFHYWNIFHYSIFGRTADFWLAENYTQVIKRFHWFTVYTKIFTVRFSSYSILCCCFVG